MMDMIHLAMNGMRSVGSVSGDVTGVKRLPSYQEWSCFSTATSVLINMVGSCFAKRIPKDDHIAVVPSQVVNAKCMVKLFGSESCPFTSRFWIALQCKGVDMHVV